MKAIFLVLAMVLGLVSVPALADTITLDITNPGFETSGTIGMGFPNVFGVWGGDQSEIVTTENGINPFEGSQMLHFIYSRRDEPGSTVGSDVWQFIDTSTFSFEIATGMAILSATAFFNRVLGDANTDTLFEVRIDAYSGTPDSKTKLASAFGTILTDSDVFTWEQAGASLTLPTGTTFVGIRISSRENVFNDTSGVEFDGHYADNVNLTLYTGASPVPEPATLTLLAAGLLAGAAFRKRFHLR